MTICCGVSSTNAACAAVRCLLSHLPDPLNKRWYSTSDLHKFVTNGEFSKLPATLVAKTLRDMQALPPSFKRDKTKDTAFYCFDNGNSDYDSPMSQYLAEAGLLSLPIIAPNFFMDNKVLSDNLIDKMRCYITERNSKQVQEQQSETSAPTGITTFVCQLVGTHQHSTSTYLDLSSWPFFQFTLLDDFSSFQPV
jgi:hypothetical protein